MYKNYIKISQCRLEVRQHLQFTKHCPLSGRYLVRGTVFHSAAARLFSSVDLGRWPVLEPGHDASDPRFGSCRNALADIVPHAYILEFNFRRLPFGRTTPVFSDGSLLTDRREKITKIMRNV